MLEVGIKAPDFELPDQNGEMSDLPALIDKNCKYFMIFFENILIQYF